jgi:RND family efflux transporter MFP subunit
MSPSPEKSRFLRSLVVPVQVAGGLLIAGLVAFLMVNRPREVVLATAILRPVAETLAVSGQVHGAREADLLPPRAGVLRHVYVREGDPVRAGQLLAEVASETQDARVTEARAGVEVAAAQLEVTRRASLPADVARARGEARRGTESARARLAQAVERLRLLEAGTRSEERDAARAALEEARAGEQNAALEAERQERLAGIADEERGAADRARSAALEAREQRAQAETAVIDLRRDRDRLGRLFEDRAVSRVSLEKAETAAETAAARLAEARAREDLADRDARREASRYEASRGYALRRSRAALAAARGAVRSAEAGLRLAESGARPEELAAARAAVREAEADLRGARTVGRAQVDAVLSLPRREDVAVAERRLEQAHRGLVIIQRDSADGELRAPFAGTIGGRPAEPGEPAGEGRPVLRLVDLSRPEIRLDTDERNLARLRTGQQAQVSLDSAPDRPFAARIVALGNRVDPDRGTLEVVLRPAPGARLPSLRPMQTAAVTVLVSSRTEAVVIPSSAVINRHGREMVLVQQRGRAVERPVRVGAVTAAGASILEGLTAGERVVERPGDLPGGARIAPRR